MGHTEVNPQINPPPFAIGRSALGGRAKIAISGELDLSTARELERVIKEVEIAGSRLVLDLSELTFIDSIGISVLLDLKRRCANLPLDLHVIPSRENSVTRVLAMTGVEEELM